MKSKKNKSGGLVMEEPIRHRLTEKGKKAWGRYRAKFAREEESREKTFDFKMTHYPQPTNRFCIDSAEFRP